MEHTMEAYLRRRTNEELDMALETCLSENATEIHNETINLILKIQNERNMQTHSPSHH